MSQRTAPLEDVGLAFVQVINQLPLLHALPEAVKAESAKLVYQQLLARYPQPVMHNNCNWPHISTALKQLPLFSVLTTEAREQIAQHIELAIFPALPTE